MIATETKNKICYLCGKVILLEWARENEMATRDHIPPKVIFPKGWRKNLLTFPTHYACNKKLSEDEEYFARVLALIVGDQSPSGFGMFLDFQRQVQRHPKHLKMIFNIMNGIRRITSSGLHLPPGTISITIDKNRFRRVVWKITRGLYFKQLGKVLPENHFHEYRHFGIEKDWPVFLRKFFLEIPPDDGSSKTFASYSYLEEGTPNLRIFVFRFWEAEVFCTIFHDVDCSCGDCSSINGGPDESR